MLNKCYILVTLALAIALFGGDSRGQSYRSNQHEQSAAPATLSANPNDNPAADQHGTEQSPLVVKILPTPETDEQPAAEAKRENEKATNDRRLGDFTEYLFIATVALSVIAFLQLIVFGWQGIQLGRTVKATTASGEAFIAGERPYLYPEHPNYGGFLPGYVKYADAFGFLHTKGFCFLNRLNKPPIELAGGRSYNYSCSEKIPDEYAT